MKKVLAILLALAAICSGADAKRMSDLKIYINPGHGGYTSNDRGIHIYPYAQNDSLGYWESKSNLYKGLFMYHMLDSLGAKPYLSRTKNTEADDRSLSGICTEANNLGVDMLISIHSNAGEADNYPLMLYREQTLGVPRYPEAVNLSKIVWKHLHSSKLPIWTLDREYIAGDLTFYKNQWEGGLGVLRTLYVLGLLSEGSMHEHRPEAHRLMNMDMCWLEAWHFVKSIMEFYNTEDRFVTGNVAGIVHDNHNLRESVMPATFTQYGRDRLAPLNGTDLALIDGTGKTIQTRTTDNDYNGVYVFRNVAPGTYTVRASRQGYRTLEQKVTVTANEVTYQDMAMTMQRDEPLKVTAYTPEAGTTVSCASTVNFTFNTDVDTESFEAAFSITPAVEGYFTYSDSYHKASFCPSKALEANMHYKVVLASSAKHPDTQSSHPQMEEDLVFEFDTRGRNRLELIGNAPAEGDRVHYAQPTLEFRFDNKVNASNIYSLLTVTDSKGNTIAVNSRNTSYNRLSDDYGNIIYGFSGNFTEGETYRVHLSGELRDRENLPMDTDVEYTITAVDMTLEAGDAEVVEPFEAKTLFAYDPEHTTGTGSATPTAKTSTTRIAGSAAQSLGYKFADVRQGEVLWRYLGETPVIYNNGDRLGLHINGDFSNHELAVALRSGTDIKYADLGVLDYRGWKYVEKNLDMLEEGYPYVLEGIRLRQVTSPVTRQGTFYVDNMTRVSGAGVSAPLADSVTIVYTDGRVTVTGATSVESIEIYDATGRSVAANYEAKELAAPLPSGIYLVRATTDSGTYVAKFAR